MSEKAEFPEHLENLMETMEAKKVVYQSKPGYSIWLDKVLPWRDYVDWELLLDEMNDLWENPEDYAGGDLSEYDGVDEKFLLHLGVGFGIEYERAYPSHERDEWPVSLEER